MRVLFLDVDGVLNSKRWLEKRPSKEAFAAEWNISPEVFAHDRDTWKLRSIDPEAVMALNAIVEDSKACVVVSSTWRTDNALPRLEMMLRRRGFKHHLLGATPISYTLDIAENRRVERGEEIFAWMKLAGVSDVRDVVIIDDDSDMAHLRSRLFQTEYEHGLCAHHVDDVVRMFGS
ncbi:MAG TPA: HAD domain-containing protein [Gemmatimonadaceae bacterium]